MLSMTEEEARSIMRSNGWVYHERPRRSLRTRYLYAERREGKKKIERYICPLSRLGELTEDELKAKLAPEAIETPGEVTETPPEPTEDP